MAKVEILDVGHGNCALVTGETEHAVIDAPRRDPLISMLRDRGITRISTIVVSHADADHLAGVQALLYDDKISVDRLYVNPEHVRSTKVWETFKVSAAKASARGTRILQPTRDNSPEIAVSDVTLEILSPSGAQVLAGGHGRIGEERFSANRLSVVIRVVYNGDGRVLLPGDMDAAALDDILDVPRDMSADVLVFPHHGGASGADEQDFADRLMNATRSSLVVFSLSHRYGNPLPNNVEQARAANAKVCCTGLSTRCETAVPKGAPCAGTVTIDLATGGWDPREANRHHDFVTSDVTDPLCRRSGSPGFGGSRSG